MSDDDLRREIADLLVEGRMMLAILERLDARQDSFGTELLMMRAQLDRLRLMLRALSKGPIE